MTKADLVNQEAAVKSHVPFSKVWKPKKNAANKSDTITVAERALVRANNNPRTPNARGNTRVEHWNSSDGPDSSSDDDDDDVFNSSSEDESAGEGPVKTPNNLRKGDHDGNPYDRASDSFQLFNVREIRREQDMLFHIKHNVDMTIPVKLTQPALVPGSASYMTEFTKAVVQQMGQGTAAKNTRSTGHLVQTFSAVVIHLTYAMIYKLYYAVEQYFFDELTTKRATILREETCPLEWPDKLFYFMRELYKQRAKIAATGLSGTFASFDNLGEEGGVEVAIKPGQCVVKYTLPRTSVLPYELRGVEGQKSFSL